MKEKIFLCLIFFGVFNVINAQKSVVDIDDERIHVFVQQKAKPMNIDPVDWKKEIMSEMKEKWNISFSEVLISFIVEKNGSITDITITSDEWIPKDDDIKELENIILKKDKWISAIHAGFNVRSVYRLKLLFQV